MIPLLLIRHGEAVESAGELGDNGRWLTRKGREVTHEVARWLAKKAARRPVAIWTSPLVRAVQTAEIIVAHRALDLDVSARRELSPGGDWTALLTEIARYEGTGPLALVGHEPMLSNIASALMPGAPWPGMKKSGVALLLWDGREPAVLGFWLRPKGMQVIHGPIAQSSE